MSPSNQPSTDFLSDGSFAPSKATGRILLYKNRNKNHVPRKPFPHKLYELLEKVEANGLSHIISWQPHGMAFIVRNPQEFAKSIMPQEFRQTKYSSFQRQLNLYGFQRLYRGPDKGGYYHYSFIRGEEVLLDRISRVRVKGTGVRQPTNVKLEPNFYALSNPDTVATTATTGVVPSTPDSTDGSSTRDNVATTTDTTVPIKPQTVQAPTPSRIFHESATQPPAAESPSSSSEGSDDEDLIELERMYPNLHIDDLDSLPEDDLGWADLVIQIFTDDNDDHAITALTSSPPQMQMQAQESPHHHTVIENSAPQKEDRCGSSMSIGSFDCTPLDFQAKPIYEFADTMASYQAFLAGPNSEMKHYIPHKKDRKARAA
mmetsp:Transcript_26869/g.35041  ORF Transcript_26869/g.35041 Transcript_26869/m.35041 type:complete len:373 (-) Transcript_26869:431-1549(-)|eukprot:CAMPEP_0195286464 /NCGR_PEP_ID=MMETSP0707-20130614/3911_1 /TAXON_ID=33640 /ORGANISM="Asterionellopsis glacialis, Strain CCMP134" /LENGTH=372 /DNA_ID=CAMNT_0040346105 /DNA_START=33 /DNA_END=1151 /DNA_ORIENTATION=+